MSDLKPCPFCGNKPEMWVDNASYSLLGEDEENTNFRISCYCGICTKLYPTKKEAEKVWNRRVTDES